MIRRIVSLHIFAALVCLAATNFAAADCASCGGGCADGGCQAAGGLLGKLGCNSGSCAPGGCLGHCGGGFGGRLFGCFGGGCQDSGPCVTCDNVWDDYCASVPHCLPARKYPLKNMTAHFGRNFGHRGCGGCGNCSDCASGVGLYGTQPCGSGPRHSLLKNLFAHVKHKASGITSGCCEPACADAGCSGGCADVGCAAGCAAPPVQYAQPAMESQPAAPAAEAEAPGAVPDAPEASPSDVPSDPVPPTPSAVDQTNAKRSTGTFDWLQRALQLN